MFLELRLYHDILLHLSTFKYVMVLFSCSFSQTRSGKQKLRELQDQERSVLSLGKERAGITETPRRNYRFGGVCAINFGTIIFHNIYCNTRVICFRQT